MIRSRRRAHDDMAVTISFNATLEPGQFPVGQQFGPAAQVESRLRLVRGKFNRQRRHYASLLLRSVARQPVLTAFQTLDHARLRLASPAAANSCHSSAPRRIPLAKASRLNFSLGE